MLMSFLETYKKDSKIDILTKNFNDLNVQINIYKLYSENDILSDYSFFITYRSFLFVISYDGKSKMTWNDFFYKSIVNRTRLTVGPFYLMVGKYYSDLIYNNFALSRSYLPRWWIDNLEMISAYIYRMIASKAADNYNFINLGAFFIHNFVSGSIAAVKFLNNEYGVKLSLDLNIKLIDGQSFNSIYIKKNNIFFSGFILFQDLFLINFLRILYKDQISYFVNIIFSPFLLLNKYEFFFYLTNFCNFYLIYSFWKFIFLVSFTLWIFTCFVKFSYKDELIIEIFFIIFVKINVRNMIQLFKESNLSNNLSI